MDSKEIELKFKLNKVPTYLIENADKTFTIETYYLCRETGEVRVLKTSDIGCFLTVKGDGGLVRGEFEVQ